MHEATPHLIEAGEDLFQREMCVALPCHFRHRLRGPHTHQQHTDGPRARNASAAMATKTRALAVLWVENSSHFFLSKS